MQYEDIKDLNTSSMNNIMGKNSVTSLLAFFIQKVFTANPKKKDGSHPAFTRELSLFLRFQGEETNLDILLRDRNPRRVYAQSLK